MLVRSTVADITQNAVITATGSGDSIVLASARNWLNSTGSASPFVPGTGRFLVYSADPFGNSFGAFSSPGNAFGRTYAANPPSDTSISSLSGNRMIYSIVPTITVAADNQSKVYGAAEPTYTYAYVSGVVAGDSVGSAIAGAPSGPTGASATAGTHAITANGLTSPLGYAFTVSSGQLTVSKAALTVSADDKAKTYGDADPVLNASASPLQLKYSDTLSVVAGLTLSAPTGSAATAGTHSISVSGGSASNYTITRVNGTLSVSKADLTVTADNKSKVYGDADPPLTYSLNPLQLKYSDTLTVVSGVVLAAPTGATAVPGNHTISVTGGTAANYRLMPVDGVLAVDRAPLAVAARDSTRSYGLANPPFSASLTGFKYGETQSALAGSLTFGVDAVTTSPAGRYSIVPSGLASANYAIRYLNGTLEVVPQDTGRTEAASALLVSAIPNIVASSSVPLGVGTAVVQASLGTSGFLNTLPATGAGGSGGDASGSGAQVSGGAGAGGAAGTGAGSSRQPATGTRERRVQSASCDGQGPMAQMNCRR